MFGLFKKKKPAIHDWQLTLLKNIFSALPEYRHFRKQLDDGILKTILVETTIQTNHVGFSFNPMVSRKYIDDKGRGFNLKGIEVFDKKSGQYINFDVFIAYGLVSGYTVHAIDFHLDPERIRTQNVEMVVLENEEFNNIKHLFSNEEIDLINPLDVYEVELEGKIYYHIKDLEDGDFIGIDAEKNVYKLTHDPYEVTALDTSLAQALSEME